MAERLGCSFCFKTLTPDDVSQGRRTFVQCDDCKCNYHQECWPSGAKCLYCDSTSASSMSIATPPALSVALRRAVLTIHTPGSRYTKQTWIVGVSATFALLLVLGALFLYPWQRSNPGYKTVPIPPMSSGQIPLEIHRLRFFAPASEGFNRLPQEYAGQFPRSMTSRVHFQVEVSNRLKNTAHTHKVVGYYYNPDGRLRGQTARDWEIQAGEDMATFNGGLYWGEIGSWAPGTYRVEVVIDEKYKAEGQFAVYEDVPKNPIPPLTEVRPPETCTEWKTAANTCATGFMRTYYEDMNRKDFSAAIAKWENPSEELRRKLYEGLKGLQSFTFQEIQMVSSASDLPMVEVRVTEYYTTRKPPTEWVARFELRQSSGTWKIVRGVK